MRYEIRTLRDEFVKEIFIEAEWQLWIILDELESKIGLELKAERLES